MAGDMKPYPHHYQVQGSADAEGWIALAASGLPTVETAAPEPFGGPGDRWSPETLLVGAVASCFVLTFRAIARASGLVWTRLRVTAGGTLERMEGGPRFTAVQVEVVLTVPADVSEDRARRLLEKAERGCLVTRSLACESVLTARIEREAAG